MLQIRLVVRQDCSGTACDILLWLQNALSLLYYIYKGNDQLNLRHTSTAIAWLKVTTEKKVQAIVECNRQVLVGSQIWLHTLVG
jgi:hypothetical protein